MYLGPNSINGPDLTHHAYPFFMKIDPSSHLNTGPSFWDRESFLAYTGWTIAEQDDTSRGGNSNLVHAMGEELDGRTPSRRTPFYQIRPTTEEGWAPEFPLTIAIPETFTTWGANGIILRSKISFPSLGNIAGTAVVTLDVADPTNAGLVYSLTATRTRTEADTNETAFEDVQVTGAALNGLSWEAGSMVHLRIKVGGVFFGLYPTFKLGRLSTYFE